MKAGDVLITVGIVLIVAGLLLKFAGGLFAWFGNLPGDIRYESDDTLVFIPITSMIVVSVLLTIVLNVLARLLGSE